MLLSRREALVGTAATVSMLPAPSVLALPALPIYPNERIYYDGAPWDEDSPIQWSGFHNSDNELIGICYQQSYERPSFSFETVASFMHSGRFARDSETDHKAVFFDLLHDNRNRFIPDEMASRLNVRFGTQRLYFFLSRGCFSIKGHGGGIVTI